MLVRCLPPAQSSLKPPLRNYLRIFVSYQSPLTNQSLCLCFDGTRPDPKPKDEITDYSQTQRIVLLIDLNPLLHLSNPSPFLTSLICSTKTLLSFPPLSSSLFSFKLFFSSLSPLLSSSKLHPFASNSSHSLSFNDSSTTLLSLSQTLSSFHAHNHQLFNSAPLSPPRASCLSASMRQLLHDYAWDSVIDDLVTGTLSNCNKNEPVILRSNLVILFSPVCRSMTCLSEFLNVENGDECLKDVDLFCAKFRTFFDDVTCGFLKRDIQFSWVDVRYELGGTKCEVEVDDSELKSRLFASGIRSLGWGFCSTDSIVLGAALVPFGLIYPKIAISFKVSDCNYSRRRVDGQLVLEILDSSGKPLECKCCDLEMAVQRSKECANFTGHLTDPILVRESSGDYNKKLKRNGEFFADRVLDMLTMEWGEIVQKKSIPIWQIVLSFLYGADYWALVSLSNGNGDSHLGILKPFTVSSALLSIVNGGVSPPNVVHDFGGAEAAQFMKKVDKRICKSNLDLRYSNDLIDSEGGPPPSNKVAKFGDRKRKSSSKKLHILQDLTWTAFCKMAIEHSELDLAEVYFARECNNSKKLKFLKCWMKQIKKSNCCNLLVEESLKPPQDIQKEINDRLTKWHPESVQPVSSSASAEENTLTEASRIQDEAALDFRSETSEAFFSNLSTKIQQGLESEGVELGPLAERLVNSSIYWLYRKCETESPSESGTLVVKSDDVGGSIIPELTKVFLKEPKELSEKIKNEVPSIQASDPGCTGFASKYLVREYELQILFRMEILRSAVGASTGESIKQKFVKQICSLLETIQCNLEGGFFGDWSLDNYVGKLIKSRYGHALGDVVHRIYLKMDLLLFADEDDCPNPSLNSEESNQSWREKLERDEPGECHRTNEPVSFEAEPLQLPPNAIGSLQGIKQEEHARRLMKAQERRERSRRFASFTSWMPDLHRVWAPKQRKLMKEKSDPLLKLSKRKEQRRVSHEMVRETPMTGNKRSCSRGRSTDDEDYQNSGSQSGGSVSKALFQDG
ncbi:hypothetical protein CJ030_MR7G015217 [Morella rubra]|uniref:Treslin n=1 Tax=Morella rubra TaxID=262757 RepID=A0A6A1UX11_9ROSI|nr:hypothetical protein CJ030_MR7G015217 [Morella rubra]